MRTLLRASILFLLLASPCLAQDPMPVIKSSWKQTTEKAPKVEQSPSGPAKQVTVDDTIVQRTARDFRTDHPDNPSDQTPDGRRAIIEKNEQDARTPQATDVRGFSYMATVRNDGAKTAKVIFWEYQFRESAHPENLTRRQFLCSVNLKKGAELELSAFSTFGPSDTIDASTPSSEKRFDEKVMINRIEYSDDSVLQRGGWKLDDVKAAVDRATSTPWGKEICRAF